MFCSCLSENSEDIFYTRIVDKYLSVAEDIMLMRNLNELEFEKK